MFSLHRWVGLDNHKDLMHCPTCSVNFCVFCYHLFSFYLDITKTEDYIYTINKGLNAIKLPTFVLFCGIKFYVSPTKPFFFNMGSIPPQVFPHRKHKN